MESEMSSTPPTTPLPPLVAQACDVEQFRASGHRLVDQIADHYLRCQRAEAGYLNFATVAARVSSPADKDDDGFQQGGSVSLQHADDAPDPVHDQDATNFRSYRRVIELLDHAPPTTQRDTQFPSSSSEEHLASLFAFVLSNTLHNHHPHNVAHQVAPPYPVAVLADFLATALGNSQAVSELSTVNGAMERVCVEFALKKVFGFVDSGAGGGGECPGREEGNKGKGPCVVPDGVMVTGGSLGNLTALLAARERWKRRVFADGKLPSTLDPSAEHFRAVEQSTGRNCSAEGSTAAEEVPLVFVSAQTHYCVERACRIMGFTADQVVKVPCCPVSFSVSAKELEKKFAEYGFCKNLESSAKTHHGHPQHDVRKFSVLAVVLSAGSTSTGAFDDLEAVSVLLKDIFGVKDVPYLHVDGAHGGAVCFLSNDLHFSNPIRRCADSVVIDTHKMLGTASNATFALFRDAADLRGCFQQEAVYLLNRAARDQADEGEDVFQKMQTAFRLWESDPVKNTVECTKPNISLRFFALLYLYGEKFFDQHLRRLFGIGALFSSLICDEKYAAAGFELVGKPRGGYLDTMESSLEISNENSTVSSGRYPEATQTSEDVAPRCYSNIVCFRLVRFGEDTAQNNVLNKTIRLRLLAGGQYYVSQTTLGEEGVVCLRCTFMVPQTEERVLRGLLDEIARIADEGEG